jgi:UTP--glucose-1-phosphate uridylyltransferase
MLPLGGKPLIQLAVEEAFAAGIRRIAVVVGPGRDSIRNRLLATPLVDTEISFPVQSSPLGVGDALARARSFVRETPFAVILPDQGLLALRSATAQLLAAWRPGPAIWSALVRIPAADVPYFPGALALQLGRSVYRKTRQVERMMDQGQECVGAAVRAIGRTVLPPAIFDFLGTGKEDLASVYIRSTLPHYAVLLEGEPWDVGTTEGHRRFASRITVG